MIVTRRQWLKRTGAAAAGLCLPAAEVIAAGGRSRRRQLHVCLAPAALEQDPGLMETVRAGGANAVWLAGFFYGHWPYSPEQMEKARRRVEQAGLEAHIVNVPLGHPGDSLGSSDAAFPLTPPHHWRMAVAADGKRCAGTSLHEPATAENVAALRRLRKQGFRQVFLDDDFRLARAPGQVGGCFCDEHRERFLRAGGYAASRWEELRADARERRLTSLLRAWIEFTCDELTGSFRAQQGVVGRGRLGIMVMYLGAEKAGIRLKDYAGMPFRVGELMFSDDQFGSVKGKTDELFSALFHRRWVAPELAYSESTAYPADRLSARNLAAKLVISTIADVRQSMLMSGVTPFPRTHWEVLGPAYKAQQSMHEQLAGHQPRGPLKHYWGEASRMVGDDRPFSLFLAAGLPFEGTDAVPGEGWTFLSDFDAAAFAQDRVVPPGAKCVCRASASAGPQGAEKMDESLPALWTFKRRLLDTSPQVPHILENEPAVCAWYPAVRRVLVWNLAEEARTLTLCHRNRRRSLGLGPLGSGVFECPD